MTRPDPRLIAAAHLVENLARRLPLVRTHVASQLNALGQLHGTSYDGAGRGGQRTVTVQVDCTGTRRCFRTDCPDYPDSDPPPHTHPCRTEGEHTHPEAVPVTAVEDYAIQRANIDNHLADLEAHAAAIATITANALRDCDRIIGVRLIDTIPRCDPTGRDGAIEWADPTCTAVPSRGPLCDRCSKREWRWRTAHGLPPRRDGVYAGDLDQAAR